MQLPQVPTSPVILSGAKDPIPVSTTTTSARSFHPFLALNSRVSTVRRFCDLEGVKQ
jgi:hypothetical protein